jgi:hypothetical protein
MMPQTPMLSRPPNIHSRKHSGCDLLTFSLLPFPAVLSISGYLSFLHICTPPGKLKLDLDPVN